MAAIHFSHLVWLLFIHFQIKMSLSVIKHYFNNFCHLGYILKNQMPLLTIFCSYTKYYHTQLINKKFSQKQYNWLAQIHIRSDRTVNWNTLSDSKIWSDSIMSQYLLDLLYWSKNYLLLKLGILGDFGNFLGSIIY